MTKLLETLEKQKKAARAIYAVRMNVHLTWHNQDGVLNQLNLLFSESDSEIYI